MATTRITLSGAAGRMGCRLVDLIHQAPDLQLVGAVESSSHPKLGADAGTLAGIGEIGLPITDQLSDATDVVIDFSLPKGAARAVAFCSDHSVPLVMATTGLSDETIASLEQAAKSIPIVWAPSMSPAVNLTMKLVEIAGKGLGNIPSGVDVEIIEHHHRFKEDAPSGTALRFGQIIAQTMGQTKHQHGRHGVTGARTQDEIGYHAVRAGDNPGQHTILFGMLGEKIELTVSASNRDCYAAGAIAAARYVVKQSNGLFNMFDVLGL